MPTTHKDHDPISGAAEFNTAPIIELDWTHRSLLEICADLSKKVCSGFVLHGSPAHDIQVLEPRLSVNFSSGEAIKEVAVFAGSQPIIVLFRAALGQALTDWREVILFRVSQSDTSQLGYIYVCNSSNFEQNPEKPSEYLARSNVRPVEKITISSTGLDKYVRTSNQVQEDFTHGAFLIRELKPEAIRETDCELALLVLIHMIEQIGILDYTMHPENSKYTAAVDLLIRTNTLLRSYENILLSEKMKSMTLKSLLRKITTDYFYTVYETEDENIINLVSNIEKKLATFLNAS